MQLNLMAILINFWMNFKRQKAKIFNEHDLACLSELAQYQHEDVFISPIMYFVKHDSILRNCASLDSHGTGVYRFCWLEGKSLKHGPQPPAPIPPTRQVEFEYYPLCEGALVIDHSHSHTTTQLIFLIKARTYKVKANVPVQCAVPDPNMEHTEEKKTETKDLFPIKNVYLE